MQYTKLGNSDLNSSKLGFGCWAVGSHGYGVVDDSDSIKAIRHALSLGVNLFDTADVYGFGYSESVLSKALGAQINDIIVATKFGLNWDEAGRIFKDCSPKRIFEAVDNSLKRLNIDSIPLYQLHYHDEVTPIEAVLEALRKCQEAGKIRYVGFSNVPIELIRSAQDILRINSFQCEYNLIQRKNERDIELCNQDMKMGTLVYNVLVRGLLSGKYDATSKFTDKDTRNKDKNFQLDNLSQTLIMLEKIKEIAYAYNKTPSQLAIKWVLDKPNITCALIGIKTIAQAEENFANYDWKLEETDINILNDLLMSKENAAK